jgi:hypothetical protein
MVRIFVYGGYRNRQPLAYAPIRERLGNRVELVDNLQDAQILTVSHHKDFELFGDRIFEFVKQYPTLKVVLLSEEPFWDSVWMPNPLARTQSFKASSGEFPFTVINHHTSPVFSATKIPYFLLTDPRYIAGYQPRLDRNAGMTAAQWHSHFQHAQIDAAFIGIRRTGRLLSPAFPQADLFALSVFRSEFAAGCRGDRIVREGQGWTNGPKRQDLSDWHADKLSRFDLQCRYLSAFENTHQPDYVSEKIFDAFAVGAMPLYSASPAHAVHRLVGSRGWVNYYDQMTPVPSMDALEPVSLQTCGDYAAIQSQLAQLFAEKGNVEREYERLCSSLVQELKTVF